MIQRRAARWTLARFHPLASVTEMLNELGWRSLEDRRIDARPVLMYKIVQGLVPVSCSSLLRPALRRSRNTHEHSFLPIVCNTSSHYLSFSPRTINQWNSIPSNIFTNCNTTVTFRQRISLLSYSSNVGDRRLCLGVWSSITHMLPEKFQFPLETVPTWRSGILAELPISARDRSRFVYLGFFHSFFSII
jgi:hypothetical protein